MHNSSDSIQLSQIWIYPVKSLGGVRLKNAQVLREGLKYDRRWMIVGPDGNFLTQRKFPEMSLLKIQMREDGFNIISAKENCSALFIPYKSEIKESFEVKVWNDVVSAVLVNKEADHWLSERLRMPVRFVAMNENSQRETYVEPTDKRFPITFSDDFPLHLISEASLDDLNNRLSLQVGVERFRPNLVVKGNLPYSEDEWQKFRIGNVMFENISACERCMMINVDQQSGIKSPEPLKTLAGYRRIDKHILFGRNIIVEQTGSIREGDLVTFERIQSPDLPFS
ncbi:MOSC domain-containing protein [Dyadobacter luteus]|uniref:MOSC domain-containing protein n=1 Tax=Dyadobacter luteus TaxID=2259619 RepID=A0A3D8Y5T7_9BACT|nr:MOSC N-terminal beta barrel domain-containing protein [Dyadobacter luteus]REA57773.1 MOSC domain-containing protein [Dyadobacter luteus]